MEEKRKSRSIPLQEYISILQLEYLSYKVRSQIFDKPFSDKYKEFCDKKKETIESFSLKQGRKCIFNDQHMFDKYTEEFFGDGHGIPDFKYRDDYQRDNIGFYDIKYYFSEGTVVIYQDEEWAVSRNLYHRGDEEILVSIKRKGSPWKKVNVKELVRKDYLKLI